MPQQVSGIRRAFDEPSLQEALRSYEGNAARYQLLAARTKREREHLAAMADACWDLINAAEVKLDDLFDTLKKRHRGGVDLNVAMAYLWNSFEGDVRFLCDHAMENDPTDKASMAHAAGNALIGLRAIIMACVRSEDQPFDVNGMLKYIAEFGGDWKGQKINKETPHPNQAWGDAVSKHG